MVRRRTARIAIAATVAGAASIGAGCGDDADAPVIEEAAAAEARPRAPRPALVRWLDAVRQGRAGEACALMSPSARSGFTPNIVGLPRSVSGRRCADTIITAGAAIAAGLAVGDRAGPFKFGGETFRLPRRCPANEGGGRARELKWLVDGEWHGGQRMCRTPEHGWRLARRVWGPPLDWMIEAER